MTAPAAPIRLPAVEVSPPPVQPYGYGLLAAASVVQDPNRRWEASGVVYENDGCAPGGGIWLHPCEHPPPAAPIDAFTVTVTQPTVGLYTVDVVLTARHASYGSLPVAVSVGGHLVQLDTVNQSEPLDLGAPGTYEVTADIAPAGSSPACGQAGQVEVVAVGGVLQPLSLTCTVTAGWPVKRIPMGVEFTEGRAFMVYESVGCLPVGFEAAGAKAERQLALHEQWWVEGYFEQDTLRSPETELLNDGAALPLVAAIGLAEDAIADRYGGHGVLHIPREHYTWIPDRLLRPDGTRKRTPLDNLWALGAGYTNTGPDDTPAPANQVWIYVTGPVVARRSEVQTRESFTPSRNERVAISERSYVLTADCLRLAVLASLPGAA